MESTKKWTLKESHSNYIYIQDKYACTMERKVMVFSTTKKEKKKNDGQSETLFVYPTANQKVV